MIIEAREDVVTLSGKLEKNLWPTIQAAANLLLRQHTQGIIVDGSGLTDCSPEGAKTFRDAMDFIERYRARIVVCRLPDTVMEVIRSVPGVRSRLPMTDSVDEARASLKLARSQAAPKVALLCDVLVPLLGAVAADAPAALACRLARADSPKANVHLLYILEIPRHLPLTAPLPEEEALAAEALAVAERRVRQEGMNAHPTVTRARDASEEILRQAEQLKANMIVFAYAPDARNEGHAEATIRAVLERASCEVILNKGAGTG